MSDKLKTRLFTSAPLIKGTTISLEPAQANYVLNTLRMKAGDALALFNGTDGEWRARITHAAKRTAEVVLEAQLRPPLPVPDLWLAFAPVKNEKIDYIIKRCTELGVAKFLPVMTARTIVSRVNLERLHANAVEAAEQCERTDVPEIISPQPLEKLLAAWPSARTLLFCDEAGGGARARELLPNLPRGPYGVLIGPEGGFTDAERRVLLGLPFVKSLSLGPRILRAETAALAALATLQPWLGDW